MERLITEEQFEKVRIHMRDTYDVAEHEWDEEELIEAIYELIAKNNEVLDLVSKPLWVVTLKIGHIHHEISSHKRKQDAVKKLCDLKSTLHNENKVYQITKINAC